MSHLECPLSPDRPVPVVGLQRRPHSDPPHQQTQSNGRHQPRLLHQPLYRLDPLSRSPARSVWPSRALCTVPASTADWLTKLAIREAASKAAVSVLGSGHWEARSEGGGVRGGGVMSGTGAATKSGSKDAQIFKKKIISRRE